MQNDNPRHNSILQALLDLQRAGYGGRSVDDMVSALQHSPKMCTDLQAVWDRHTYPEDALTWTRIYGGDASTQDMTATIEQMWAVMSPAAAKVFLLLARQCGSSGMIQASMPIIAALTGISPRSVSPAVQELINIGAIVCVSKAKQRIPAIYQVNPVLTRTGKISQTLLSQYAKTQAKAQAETKRSPKPLQPPAYLPTTETVYDGELRYTRLAAITPAEAKEKRMATDAHKAAAKEAAVTRSRPASPAAKRKGAPVATTEAPGTSLLDIKKPYCPDDTTPFGQLSINDAAELDDLFQAAQPDD